jgi:hypothetical protein
MAAYKQFNSQDIIISPLEVNKSFHFVGGDILTGSDVGIDRYIGRTGNYLISGSQTTGKISGQEQSAVLVYNSIKQLYYGNYISGSGGFIQDAVTASFNTDGTITGPIQTTNYYDYPQTTVWSNKTFPTASTELESVPIGVISIPSKLYGDYIQPNSFSLKHNTSGSIQDDGNGRLLWKEAGAEDSSYSYLAGNIIYQHGIVTLLNDESIGISGGSYGEAIYGFSTYGGEITAIEFIEAFISSSQVTMSFSSSYEIFETQYKCTIAEKEFNYSLNPSVLSGSQGDLYNQFTGSYFDPYVTTVGLYSPNYELLAIGKLAKPLPTSRTTDTTILINIDR